MIVSQWIVYGWVATVYFILFSVCLTDLENNWERFWLSVFAIHFLLFHTLLLTYFSNDLNWSCSRGISLWFFLYLFNFISGSFHIISQVLYAIHSFRLDKWNPRTSVLVSLNVFKMDAQWLVTSIVWNDCSLAYRDSWLVHLLVFQCWIINLFDCKAVLLLIALYGKP